MPLHCSNGKKTTAFPATKETKDAKPVGCKQACSEQVRADPLLILRSNVMCTTDNVRRGKPTYLVPYTVPFKVPTPSLYLHCIYSNIQVGTLRHSIYTVQRRPLEPPQREEGGRLTHTRATRCLVSMHRTEQSRSLRATQWAAH